TICCSRENRGSSRLQFRNSKTRVTFKATNNSEHHNYLLSLLDSHGRRVVVHGEWRLLVKTACGRSAHSQPALHTARLLDDRPSDIAVYIRAVQGRRLWCR
ncbi:hypothetical protein WG66_009803, partial [Moniliophthora roreri]